MVELNSIVEEVINKHAGVSIKELNKTISYTLENRLSSFSLTNLKYKDAKKSFQKAYFQELLTLNLGNISKAAKKAGLNRRQIHRICSEVGIDQKDIRRQMLKPYNYLKQNIQEIIEERIEFSKDSINKLSVDKIYKKMPKIADNITEFIEDRIEPYDDAILTFEKHYFQEILIIANNSPNKAAEMAGLSKRSILRRMQTLEIA